jgi:hypothetical protein
VLGSHLLRTPPKPDPQLRRAFGHDDRELVMLMSIPMRPSTGLVQQSRRRVSHSFDPGVFARSASM